MRAAIKFGILATVFGAGVATGLYIAKKRYEKPLEVIDPWIDRKKENNSEENESVVISKEEVGEKEESEYREELSENTQSEDERPIFAPREGDTVEKIDYCDLGAEKDYDILELEYTSDNVLIDLNNVKVYNPLSTVGEDAFIAFDEGDEIVYVRNDYLRCYFEIFRTERNYTDIIEDERYQKGIRV